MFDKTLDNYLEEEDGSISEEEWKSTYFKYVLDWLLLRRSIVLCIMIYIQAHMFKNTKLDYIYQNFKGKYFTKTVSVKIRKIIDFGRATFVDNKTFYDVFKKNGDAEGQYSFHIKIVLKIVK